MMTILGDALQSSMFMTSLVAMDGKALPMEVSRTARDVLVRNMS
jgi:hypothetical protein